MDAINKEVTRPSRYMDWMWFLALLRQARKLIFTAVIGGFLGATLIRLSPGFEVDERAIDSRLSPESQAAAARQLAENRNVGLFYLRYLAGVVRGNLGFSRALNRPISELLEERLPATLKSLAFGVAGGALAGFSLALLTVFPRSKGLNLIASAFSGLCLCLPAAVVALFFLWMRTPGRWAISVAVFPQVYRYSKNLFTASYNSPHVISAQARGVPAWRIISAHVVAPVAPQMAALAGLSVTLAFGASIPIEVLCDTPGIGQLAWQAALARDLPLLVTITVVLAILTVLANSISELAFASRESAQATGRGAKRKTNSADFAEVRHDTACLRARLGQVLERTGIASEPGSPLGPLGSGCDEVRLAGAPSGPGESVPREFSQRLR